MYNELMLFACLHATFGYSQIVLALSLVAGSFIRCAAIIQLSLVLTSFVGCLLLLFNSYGLLED